MALCRSDSSSWNGISLSDTKRYSRGGGSLVVGENTKENVFSPSAGLCCKPFHFLQQSDEISVIQSPEMTPCIPDSEPAAETTKRCVIQRISCIPVRRDTEGPWTPFKFSAIYIVTYRRSI